MNQLPGLHHDPNRPVDVLKVDADEDGVGGEDAADALRYLVATKSRVSRAAWRVWPEVVRAALAISRT